MRTAIAPHELLPEGLYLEIEGKYYRDETVSIPELVAREGKVLDGFTFENCQIEGPAILLLRGTTSENNDIQGSVDAILWEIPQRRQQVIGAVLAQNCTLRGCDISEIGFAGWPDSMRIFKRGITRA